MSEINLNVDKPAEARFPNRKSKGKQQRPGQRFPSQLKVSPLEFGSKSSNPKIGAKTHFHPPPPLSHNLLSELELMPRRISSNNKKEIIPENRGPKSLELILEKLM